MEVQARCSAGTGVPGVFRGLRLRDRDFTHHSLQYPLRAILLMMRAVRNLYRPAIARRPGKMAYKLSRQYRKQHHAPDGTLGHPWGRRRAGLWARRLPRGHGGACLRAIAFKPNTLPALVLTTAAVIAQC